MKIELCNEKLQHVNIYVSAELSEGILKITGQDVGRYCEEILGDSDYEYFYIFDVKIQKNCLIFYWMNPQLIN